MPGNMPRGYANPVTRRFPLRSDPAGLDRGNLLGQLCRHNSVPLFDPTVKNNFVILVARIGKTDINGLPTIGVQPWVRLRSRTLLGFASAATWQSSIYRLGTRCREDSMNRLDFGPAAVRYGTHTLLEGDEPIGSDLLKSFVQAIWPIHVNVRRSGVAETEMQARIAARVKAGLT